MSKNLFRERMLARRRTLSPENLAVVSSSAQRLLLSLPAFKEAKTVALYAACHGEIGTDLLWESGIVSGKKICFPAVVGKSLEFRVVTKPGDFTPGPYGISQPASGLPVLCPEEISLYVLPGVAFDHAGHRIGYGKGYYDRTLHSCCGKGKLTGLCHDFQLLDQIPALPHDVTMDRIVTEHRVLSLCD